MGNILEDAISSIAQSPSGAIQEITSSAGLRTKVLQVTGQAGGVLAGLADSTSEPRKTYNFKVTINTPPGAHGIEANIKSIERPKITMEYKTIRYLNTVRRQLKAVHFDPITMVIYDDLAGTVQKDMEKLISKTASTTPKIGNFHLGESIDLRDFDQSILDSIVIHSSASPVSSLVSGGFKTAANVLSGGSIMSSITDGFSGAGPRNMTMKNCTVERIDFGEFNYAESEANLISLTVSYQSLEFGSTVESPLLSIASGIGGRILSGGF